MKNNKGITLVSLIGYIVISLMVLSVLIMVTSNFRKNFGELNVQTVHEIEFDKINLQISKEIKSGKKIDRTNFSSTQLIFSDGNTYTYVAADKALYMNNKIAIAEHLQDCKFELPTEDTLRVTAQIENKTRKMEFPLNGEHNETYVARIGEQYYTTLQKAIDAVPLNNEETTIVVLADIFENVTIVEKKNIILDIGIYTISNKEDMAIITSNGKLKIKNGTIIGNQTSKPIISNKSTGILNIVGGMITSETSAAVENYGTTEISELAKITGKSAIVNRASGNLITTGGSITATVDSNAINNYGTIEINVNTKLLSTKATIYNRENAIANITGGEINSKSSNAIVNYGELNISNTADLKSSASSFPTISNQVNAKLNISGGTITSENCHAINNHGVLEISGTAKLSATALANPTIYNQSNSIIRITDGTITATNSVTLYNEENGEITISGGNMQSNNANLINNFGKVSISGTAIFEGRGENNPTIYNNESGNLTITGGEITSAKSQSIYNLGTATVSANVILNGSTYGI